MIDAGITTFFIAAIVLLGLRGGRGGQGLPGYVLAGRTLTLPLFVGTLVPTFYGGVLGIGEFTWRNGLSNWLVMAFPYYIFAALYAFFLAGRVRLEGGLTIPDHLERAYGRPLAVFAAGLVFLLACPADELLMVGTLLSRLSGWALPISMAAAGAAGLGLVLRGGLRSDVSANRLQFVMMFGGFAVILPFAFMKLGGLGALQAGLPPGHLTLAGGLRPLQILGWWLLALWTLVDPSFHQRCAAAESPRVARHGILISIGFWALFDLMTTAAGLYARLAEPTLADPLLAFPVLADRLLPPVARGLFFAGMSASMFAALQGTALLSAVSLGKDGLGRWAQASEEAQERWARAALPVTGALAFTLALALPSVVGLWYCVGSVVIPGLLLPLLGVYYSRLRAPAPWALASSVGGSALAALWLWRGAGVDPMFPGLGLASALWAAGLYSGLRASARRRP
ncbi:MAG: hypothetical protein AAB320_03340 [Elusimicrobiota bacterium]